MTGPRGQGEKLTHRRSRRHFLQGVAGLGLSAGGLALLAGCSSQVAPFFGRATGDQLEARRQASPIRHVSAKTKPMYPANCPCANMPVWMMKLLRQER